MIDEYLTRCVVDTLRRTITIYSSEGDEKIVTCDTVDEFMNVLNLVRETCPEDVLVYSDPI